MKIYISLIISVLISLLSACDDTEQNATTEPKSQEVAGGIEAITQMDSLIARQPNNPNLYYRRGVIHSQLNNPEAAIADLEKAKELNDTLQYIYLAEADIYLNTNNPLLGFPDSKKAIQTLESFIEKKPENITVKAELARLHSIVLQFKESNQILSEIMELQPTEAKWRFFLGNNLREMGDTSSALQAYQRAIELNPEFIDAYSEAGYLMEKQGNDLAIQMYANSLRLNPNDALIQFNYATCLHTFERFDEAIQAFKKAIELEAQNPAAFYNLGLAYYDLDSLEQASRAFENAVRMAPDLVNGYYMLGLTSEMMGKNKDALQFYQTTLNLDPEFTVAQKAMNDLLQKVQSNS